MSTLGELIVGLDYRVLRFRDVPIIGIGYHSGRIKSGEIFIAMRGERFDSHRFIAEAVKNGAVAVVVNEEVPFDLPQIVTDDPRKVMAELAVRLYRPYLDRITLIGITGTNGKTTTSYLIRAILRSAGLTCGLIGSVEYDDGISITKAHHTTPEIIDLLDLIKKMVENGLSYAVIEVTSHGLKLNRVKGLPFPIRIFTNISRDHLDFHKDFEDYKKTKLSFFIGLEKGTTAIVNIDDPLGREIVQTTEARVVTYGIGRGDFRAGDIQTTDKDLRFLIIEKENSIPVRLNLLGQHNLYNGLAAFITGRSVGINDQDLVRGLGSVSIIPGRLMPVKNDQDLKIYVDFAHTPDALRQVLISIRAITQGRVIVIFGCGGDRDRGKRPQMGKIATELADLAIVTSDNPRGEEPLAIINEIESGIEKDNYLVEPDRRKAIMKGIELMKRDDLLLIAGKGHEEYQLVRDRRVPFNDARVVEEVLRCSS
ncbi:MAG TPA: UDP-N-acetylmuramoyl-L-alanyl-D-glutamate--2,6-diaminopimelate ligase [bacterium (Candidatus Stahlbacteria)]|nr:UDP-N-acetylmuramoyl-L-alanyl-D-glutamate--2,6-diaminopimelate ligase [Candidatus Stahlbacteria bacterium]